MRAPATLWSALAAPIVWALHFLLCYGTVAIACAKHYAVGSAQIAAAMYTLAALVCIAVFARRSWQHDAAGWEPANAPTATFLHGLTLLLAGLSALGTLYVALPILVFADCR